jgi:hypothetical protein
MQVHRNNSCSSLPLSSCEEIPSDENALRSTCLKLWEDIETDLLHGQSMQGLEVCMKIVEYLDSAEKISLMNHDSTSVTKSENFKHKQISFSKFALIRRIHSISLDGAPPDTLFDWN